MGLEGNGFEPEIALVFETGAVASLVSVLLDIRDEPHSASDICDHAGISRGTFYEHADQLKEYGILEQVDFGSASGYRLAETEVAAKLIELECELEDHRADVLETET
ncbi:winged helix-turn-helix domain-containing protein [Natronorubrum sp. FCH18a]|uniref:winged helix-turn-helix domain-containing protein n=1 Tax=Natronorubrum sp. FCH18a TaxID=3447018 RepID=UPI003F51273C